MLSKTEAGKSWTSRFVIVGFLFLKKGVAGIDTSRRPTIADVAQRAGVSTVAVSYALNGRSGVSESTRRRILEVAADLKWQPNRAARALAGTRAGLVGLALVRNAETLGVEPFYMRLIAGIEATLSARSIGLVLQLADSAANEMQIYERWTAQRHVDGVLITDFRSRDPRIGKLKSLGLPAVVVGGSATAGSLPRVWTDDRGAMTAVVNYLATLGHRHIASVAGLPEFMHTQVRSQAFRKTAQKFDMRTRTMTTDFSGAAGADATRTLLSARDRPTAVIYANDAMAIAGMSAAHEMGLAVPADVSIIGWDDSVLCQLVHPPITAVSRDINKLGSMVAQQLLALLDGEHVAAREEAKPRLIVRGSTAPWHPDRRP